MKWDIDKALESYGQPGVLIEHSVVRVLIHRGQWKNHRLNPKLTDPNQESVLAWSLGVGRWGHPKLFVMALTLREAHLRLRKIIMKMDQEPANLYGVRFKPKRNKFERRERKPKKPVEVKPTKKKAK
jgi:hypothetical protein